MPVKSFDCTEGSDGITFKIRVQPRASRSALVGFIDGVLKIALTSPPAEGAANLAIVEFWADFCKVAKSKVTITSGLKSRNKIIKINDVSKEKFLSLINKSLTLS